MNVYTHSQLAGIQALEQAESDLEAGEVKLALVCTGTGFEDPLAVMRAGREAGRRVFCEGAAAILLAPNGRRQEWKLSSRDVPEEYFGIGDEIFRFESQLKAASA
jgi:3-oxoacyl-[acyl-carrier-protein] synthase III